MEPRYSEYKSKVRASFDRQGFMKHINAKLIEVEPGYCEIQVPYHKNLSQQHGFFHAGVIGTLADNAAGYSSFSLMEEHSSVLTVEFKLNLLSPAKGDLLIGRANVLKSGKTLTVCRSEVYVVDQGKEKLCAAAQATLIQLHNQPDE
jgi:uncharacterized protein (TIGR00369 family)